MFNSSGIFINDVIMILSKEALFSEESNFFEGFEDKKSIQNSTGSKCCSGVIISCKDTEVLRLSGSSPAKFARQIKKQRLFIK